MGLSEQLSVVTSVSRPELLPAIAPTVPPDAEWVIVGDGPQEIPAGLRPHVYLEGPETRRWGAAQKRVGLEAASRPFVYFLDDDNVMHPGLAELLVPYLERRDAAGALVGLLARSKGRVYMWPPPTRVERSQVDTAMFFGRREAALNVRYEGRRGGGGGWPDLEDGTWPHREDSHGDDAVFIGAFDQTFGLLRLPAIYGFKNGLFVLRDFEPDAHAALEAGDPDPELVPGVLHRYMIQADSPPWWKSRAAAKAETAG
jgi:hypothetical protein